MNNKMIHPPRNPALCKILMPHQSTNTKDVSINNIKSIPNASISYSLSVTVSEGQLENANIAMQIMMPKYGTSSNTASSGFNPARLKIRQVGYSSRTAITMSRRSIYSILVLTFT